MKQQGVKWPPQALKCIYEYILMCEYLALQGFSKSYFIKYAVIELIQRSLVIILDPYWLTATWTIM